MNRQIKPWKRRRPAAAPTRAPAPVVDDLGSELVELRMTVTRQMANELEAGVPCRELRLERIGEDRAALLIYASNREQWQLNVLAHAEHAHLN